MKTSNYITAGELAKLAGTTKRTILWYDNLGILKPKKFDINGYRGYLPSQVLEYQMILLLSTLGVSLVEIGDYLKKRGNLTRLFEEKRSYIKQRIGNLEFSLASLDRFSRNLKRTKTMVVPRIIRMKAMPIYYVERVGAYVDIGNFGVELRHMFSSLGRGRFVTMTIFEDPNYSPEASRMKIAVLASPGMRIAAKYKSEVKIMKFSPGKVITWTHNGEGRLLSLFWKELEKYCRLSRIKVRHDIPDFEIYRKESDDPSKQFFEIYLPVCG